MVVDSLYLMLGRPRWLVLKHAASFLYYYNIILLLLLLYQAGPIKASGVARNESSVT